MKIAVNTRFLLKNKLEGIGIYTQEIFKRVVKLLPQHEFYFLFDRNFDREFIFAENVTPVIVSPYARHPVLWYWWFERAVPKILKENDIELFISPDGYGSLHIDIPQMITVHDLAFEHYVKHTPFLVNNYYRYFVPEYCRKADKILAVSEFTKQDIISSYKIDAQKIEVVHNGTDESIFSFRHDAHILSNYHLKEKEYFIFIGAVHPRKNVLGLLQAFEHFKNTYQHPHRLVIVGRKAWMNKELESFYAGMQHKNDVTWIEKTDRSHLFEILSHAFALVYPSFFEGFGIPIIEAMSAGIPVITSNLSSMPEVAGNAAILVNPKDIDEISTAMNQLVMSNDLYKELIEKGKLRSKDFSWDTSAKKVAEIIQRYQK
jgi:glycosyltransferase involved in cell wall biosynthesis